MITFWRNDTITNMLKHFYSIFIISSWCFIHISTNDWCHCNVIIRIVTIFIVNYCKYLPKTMTSKNLNIFQNAKLTFTRKQFRCYWNKVLKCLEMIRNYFRMKVRAHRNNGFARRFKIANRSHLDYILWSYLGKYMDNLCLKEL